VKKYLLDPKRGVKVVVLVAGMFAVGNFFVNCSDVSFDQSKNSSSGTTPSPDGTGVDGTLGQPGTNPPGGTTPPGGTNPPGGTTNPPGGTVNNPPGGTTPPGGTVPPGTQLAPPSIIPRVRFIGPPCVRGSNCLVAFELDQPYANQVDYDWLTNDTAYMTPSTPIYGQPNVHYVPTGGHITFAPGTIRKEVYVQNINPDPALAILIGLRMRNCMYGGVAANCTAFFR
jgi:hypothetical protein